MPSPTRRALLGFLLLAATALPAGASELSDNLAALRQGGFVIVLRHFATDPSQQDVVPLDFDNMRAQRQLSDAGRAEARAIGAALPRLGVPIGNVFTSRLNRAIESGRWMTSGTITPVDELTDSSAGNPVSMAGNTGGGNGAFGRALQRLAN